MLLDANALMSAARLKVDLAAQLAAVAPGWEAVVPSSVLKELEGLGGTRHARGARALAARFRAVEAAGQGDGAIVAAATGRAGRAVLTNDRALRRRLRDRGVPVVYLRGKQKLDVDGVL
ncbi:MAG TPA: twitching motility protein PilT [Candidatus Thermoplasmatota archaeon]